MAADLVPRLPGFGGAKLGGDRQGDLGGLRIQREKSHALGEQAGQWLADQWPTT